MTAHAHVGSSTRRHFVVTGSLWSRHKLDVQLARVKRIGVAKVPYGLLLECGYQGIYQFGKRCLSQLSPILVELSRRVECHQVPGILTKTQLCAIVGCSLRWLEVIVSRAKQRTGNDTDRGGASEPAAASQAFDLPTSQELVTEIMAYAMKKLEPLMRQGLWNRYRNVCRLLAQHFAACLMIEHPSDSNPENGARAED